MASGTWPMAITALPGSTAATVAWRRQGRRLYVTVVVKGTFAIVPNGPMRLIEPEPIAIDEVPDETGRGLRTPGDLAPHLSQVDVLLTGHAFPPPGRQASAPTVRLALARDGIMVIDSALTFDPQLVAEPGRGLRITGMGPLSKEWPIRSRLRGATDPRALHGPRLAIPEPFDWSYFQAAPLNQRATEIRGDEWLLLEGIYSDRPRLETRLPGARGAAMVYGRALHLRVGRPLSLVVDTIAIDADRRRCSILWRCNFPAPGDEGLDAIRIVAGVEPPGQKLAWFDPFQVDETRASIAVQAPAAAQAPPAENPFAGTMDLSGVMAALANAKKVTPFQSEEPAAHPGAALRMAAARENALELPFAGTMDLSGSAGVAAGAKKAIPFLPPSMPFTAPAAPAPEPVSPPAEMAEETPFTGTVDLSELAAMMAAGRETTPFKPSAADGAAPVNSPVDAVPFAGTIDLSGFMAAMAGAKQALPFGQDAAVAAPNQATSVEVAAALRGSPTPAAAQENLFTGTMDMGAVASLMAGAREATPFDRHEAELCSVVAPLSPAERGVSPRPGDESLAALPATGSWLEALRPGGSPAEEWPEELGAQFLAAMEEAQAWDPALLR